MVYQTPGVYIQEISASPASVVEVETAIPAFIGYTEKAEENGEDLTNKPKRIKTLVEFEQLFGGPARPKTLRVRLDAANRPDRVTVEHHYVWKAPANISLNSVISPTVPISDADQQSLNVDVNAGKSINAIRTIPGRGTLIWGARTLAGNDNEWRYVAVRRFFNMVEASVKKSTAWVVFEPNAAPLWTKVKHMIENYLIQKWREGALMGAKAEHAFFVNIGLGQTMTAQDIAEGRMIVEIGMAAVRPAEFIILKLIHKMQKS